MAYIIGTKKEIETIQAIDTVDNGLPLRGVHAGSGRHVPISETPADGSGWTMRRYHIERHPERDDYAIEIDEVFEQKSAQKLSPKEQALIEKKVESLPADWKREQEMIRK